MRLGFCQLYDITYCMHVPTCAIELGPALSDTFKSEDERLQNARSQQCLYASTISTSGNDYVLECYWPLLTYPLRVRCKLAAAASITSKEEVMAAFVRCFGHIVTVLVLCGIGRGNCSCCTYGISPETPGMNIYIHVFITVT